MALCRVMLVSYARKASKVRRPRLRRGGAHGRPLHPCAGVLAHAESAGGPVVGGQFSFPTRGAILAALLSAPWRVLAKTMPHPSARQADPFRKGHQKPRG